jgi:membrane-bound lytic murein transglycosylase D
MRPTTAILLSVFLTTLAPDALAQRPRPVLVAAASEPQALPPAKVPEPQFVGAGIELSGPTPTAERVLHEDGDAVAPPTDTPDDPAVGAEIDKESQEMEEMRQAEEATHPEDQVAPHASGEGRIALIPELDHDLAQLQAEYDIPIDVNEAVVGYIRFFQSRAARPHFVKWLGRSHRYMERYRALMKEAGLPQDTVFLAMIESGFGNFAYSRAKASGPWQFIAGTGKLFGLKNDFWVDERRDPEKSAKAAARYLKQLYEQTGDWRLAWAGYNAGVGRIYKAKDKGFDDFWDMAATKGKKVLRPETKGYVPKLMAAAIITKHPEAFGFKADEIEPQSWTEYETATIPSATLLSVVAKAAEVSEKDIIDLNPELRRACTPPRPYEIKIPKGQAETFAANWPTVQSKARVTFAAHVVRRGDTLSSIAVHYGVPVQGIMEMNGLRKVKKLRVGTELVIPKPVGAALAARTPEREREPARRPEAAAARANPPETLVASAAPVVAAGSVATKSTLRVEAGDTLWSIAKRLGVELGQLCKWNGIENPRRHKLMAGTLLVVYAPQRG